MKLRLDKKGLSPLVAVIVLLTLVMVLGAIIAGTLSGAPRPVLPATTAVNLMTPYGGNPAAGDQTLVIRHEYGQPISDAYASDGENVTWVDMVLLVNGARVEATWHPGEEVAAGTYDFEIGNMLVIDLPTSLESSDLVQLVWEPRDLMLVEYLVQ